MKKLNIVVICITVLASAVATVYGAASPEWQAVVDSSGNMRAPKDYRARYDFLGAWVVAGEGPAVRELHVVYASPGVIDDYRRSKRFEDGAVLVKEIFEAQTAPMTTGRVSRADTLKGWFLMVKGPKGTYPGNKLWGDGWGWAWFDAANPAKTTSTDYKLDCLGCHVPARATDWVYVDGYPPLR